MYVAWSKKSLTFIIEMIDHDGIQLQILFFSFGALGPRLPLFFNGNITTAKWHMCAVPQRVK